MKQNKLTLNPTTTLGIIGIGAITGGIAGTVALASYALLTSKGALAATLSGKRALGGIVLPGSIGALFGGGTAFGVTQKKLKTTEASIKKQATTLKQQNQQLGVLEKQHSESSDHIEQLEKRQIDASNYIEQLKKQLINPPAKLEDIKGIGPKFAKKLHKAQIHTIEDLAQKNTDDIKIALGLSVSENMFSAEDWIKQARKLSQTKI